MAGDQESIRSGAEPVTPRGRLRLRTRLILAASVTVVALLLAEVALRIFGVAAESVAIRFMGKENALGTVRDPELFWRFVPRGGHDPIHDIGIRGEPFSAPREERDLRILCVGDSCAFGLFVRPHESWAMVLDRHLQARLPNVCVETAVAAAPGYSTYQDLVLLRRHAGLFTSDVTILFVGSWNDMLPAAGYRDSEYGSEVDRLEHHPLWSLRLGRLLWRGLHPIPTVDDMKRRFEHASLQTQTGAARVSVPEFRENVRALVGIARATGVVLAIVPSAETVTFGFPWSIEYRHALLDVYRELAVPCVDGDDAFRTFAARYSEARFAAGDFMYKDHIHPTALGHAALAEALEPVVLDTAAARVHTMDGLGLLRRATISSVEPETLQPGHQARLRIRGEGFAGPATPLRICVNDQAVLGFQITGDSAIDLDVKPEFLSKPGPLAIELRSRAGVLRAAPAPLVLPWSPEVTATERGGSRIVHLSLDAESAIAASAWISTETLDKPHETRWGPFRLKDPRPEHSAGPSDNQTTLVGLELPNIDIVRWERAPSPAAGEVTLPAGVGASAPLYAQVLIRYGYHPEAAWLSDVIRVRVGNPESRK